MSQLFLASLISAIISATVYFMRSSRANRPMWLAASMVAGIVALGCFGGALIAAAD